MGKMKGGDYMKKIFSLVFSVLFVLSVAGLSFAEEQKAAAPAAPAPAAAPKKVEKMKTQNFTGDITAIDAAANTITLKDKDVELTVTTTAKTHVIVKGKRKSLSDLKAGDKVEVRYRAKDGKNKALRIIVMAL